MMDKYVREFKVEYGWGTKILLAWPIVLVIILGFMFLINTNTSSIFPKESKQDSVKAAIILFATPLFIIIVYSMALPRAICVFQDRIRITYGLFNWTIPYKDIISFQPKKGIPLFTLNSSVTSLKSQIEIVRKNKFNIRISPGDRDAFLADARRCMNEWQNQDS